MNKVVIVGTTTWGTTLGIVIASNGNPVTLLARTYDEAQEMSLNNCNNRFLPGVDFPNGLRISSDVSKAFIECELLILAVPSISLRQNIRWVKDHVDESMIVVSATKGLEQSTGQRMSQVLIDELPDGCQQNIAVISGPNLAAEIIDGHPTSTVVAAYNHDIAQIVQGVLMNSKIRVYTSKDVAGIEFGGALKNIIALGAGISDGLGYGDNTKSALITRGLSEITRLGTAAGADPQTFAGLAGVGDIIATCNSKLSRNYSVGVQLTKGLILEDILLDMDNVVESVYTTTAALSIATSLGVDMPLTRALHRVLYENLDPRQAVLELMGRPPKSEDS